MKKQSNSLKPNHFFNKVKLWIYNLFHIDLNVNLKDENNDSKSDSLIKTENEVSKKSFFDEYKVKNERRDYLLNLQKKYKAKEILENDMNEQDRIDLENMYVEQNIELKRKIRAIESKLIKANK